jgi:hypothetical protein
MSSWRPSAQELKDFVLNNVNNRLGHDVQEKVMPQVEGFGGCQGICESLGGSLSAGIKSAEVPDRKAQYGINYIEPDPPTPFWQFCLDALEDFTLRLLLFFAAMSTVRLHAIPRSLLLTRSRGPVALRSLALLGPRP